MESPETTPTPGVNEALAQVGLIEQRVQLMGANDYEPSAFARIRAQLDAGALTPREAIAHAQAVLDSKQDYH